MLVIPIFSLKLNQFDGFKAEKRERERGRERTKGEGRRERERECVCVREGGIQTDKF